NGRSRDDPRAACLDSRFSHCPPAAAAAAGPAPGVANPVRAPFAGEGVPLLVKLIVPLRFTPGGASTLVNRTPTVQVPPGGMACPVQAFWPSTRLKNQVSNDPPGPFVTVTLLTVMLAPVPSCGAPLVRTTMPASVMAPAGIVMVTGATETVARFATPVPVSVTGVGSTTAPAVVYAT